MTATIDISGQTHRVARMDARSVRILMEAGALPYDGRVELVDGALIEMSPANHPHSSVHSELHFALRRQLQPGWHCLIDAAVYLADDLMLGPDIVVLRRPLVSHQAAGPDFDLIIEVSDATLTQDLGWKAERYARHGVAEYWVVDLVNRLLHIHRGPGEDGYGEVSATPWDLPAEPQRLPGVALTLAEILEP